MEKKKRTTATGQAKGSSMWTSAVACSLFCPLFIISSSMLR